MFIFICGFNISLLYSYFILPKNSGDPPTLKPTIYPIMSNGMIIIPYKKKALHVHHWVVYFYICLLSMFIQIPIILTGFSFGLFIQGIKYKDSFCFICENPY